MATSILIRLIRTPGIVQTAISWWTNSMFDHVEFGVRNPDGSIHSWLGAHAQGGIEERIPNYCTPTLDYRYAIPCSDIQYQQWLTSARARIGTPYNFADIIGLLLHNREFNKVGSDICSQFVVSELALVGIWLLNVEPDAMYLITPQSIYLSPLLIGRR